ncbi:MAG TPA: hypothetical protein VG225_02490 [Terracidiphilus sp.]|jgi:hypothetical protein|nr:hypothetical protein [Terracidiphilus sp.]
MGKWAFLLLAAVLLPAAPAQTRMSVDQVEQFLASSAKQPEDRLAAQLAGFELTQRVTAERLARWQSHCKGQRSCATLMALADAAAFLDLPPEDLPGDPPPDQATEAAILSRAKDYVRAMRPRLPNFSALRTTTQFETATPQEMLEQERSVQFQQMSNAKLDYRLLGDAGQAGVELYQAGITESRITYRDGGEVTSPEPKTHKHLRLAPRGLASAGEFGPILSMVDHDAARGHIAWHHWERSASGAGEPLTLLAVYRYSVPSKESHFAIFSDNGSFPGLPPEEDHPGYHGEIAVHPADGSIFRISIVADPDAADPGALSALMVEYGSVTIGSKLYMCPVHGAAISTIHVGEAAGSSRASTPLRKFVNDVTFTQFHLFRSESRILP